MSYRKPRVLVVDDDPDQLELLGTVLQFDGFTVETTTCPIGVSNTVRSTQPDFVLLDLDLPAIPGERLLELARPHAPEKTLFVLYSGCAIETLRERAEQVGADGFLSKQVAPSEVPARLRRLRAERARKPSSRPSPMG